MNRTYKLVWSTVSQHWTVASELAKGSKKSSGKTFRLAALVAAGLTAGAASAAPAVDALPAGEKVASGRATFDRSISNQLTVNQSSSKLITNWNSFDVGANGKVVFAQPDAGSIALNRVSSGSATQIFGQVTANGQLVLVNPNGITFGAGSQVSAASIIGSVLNIQDSDFNSGNLLFNRGSTTASIDNQGSLMATSGSLSLLAPTVKNSGTLAATAGNASLINANAVNLTMAEPSITAASSITGLIKNTGNITATQMGNVGGRIMLLGNTNNSNSKVALAGTLRANDTTVTASQIQVTAVLAVDGARHQLSLNSSTPYTLGAGSKINLNGIYSGFSVNGTAYTVIRDVNQLQAINTDLAGSYVLARDVNASATSNWNAGAGFVPLGNAGIAFSGILDGLGHSVNSLVINTPGSSNVGLIGSSSAAQISNIGLKSASIHGWSEVGGLVGWNDSSSINNSYASGSVRGGEFCRWSGWSQLQCNHQQ